MQWQHHVFQHAQMVQQPEILKHHADLPPHVAVGAAPDLGEVAVELAVAVTALVAVVLGLVQPELVAVLVTEDVGV